jgi:hypothetical protein
MGRILPIFDCVCLGASRKPFSVGAPACRAVVDSIAKPIAEATASDTMHNRASCAIFVALTPPYYSRYCVKTSIFVFCNIAQFACKKIEKGRMFQFSRSNWISINRKDALYVLVGASINWQLQSNPCPSRPLH